MSRNSFLLNLSVLLTMTFELASNDHFFKLCSVTIMRHLEGHQKVGLLPLTVVSTDCTHCMTAKRNLRQTLATACFCRQRDIIDIARNVTKPNDHSGPLIIIAFAHSEEDLDWSLEIVSSLTINLLPSEKRHMIFFCSWVPPASNKRVEVALQKYYLSMFRQTSLTFYIYLNATSGGATMFEMYRINNAVNVVEKVAPRDCLWCIEIRRSNMRRTVIRLVHLVDAAFVPFLVFEPDGSVSSKCVASDLYEMMTVPFNITAVNVPGTAWISQNPNGSLTGMAQQILNNEADMTIVYSEIVPYRAKALSFTQPLNIATLEVFYLPFSITEGKNILRQPFSSAMWASILIAVFLMATVMWYIGRVGAEKNRPEQERWKGFTDFLLGSIGLLCQQGSSTSPWSVSMRALVFTTLLLTWTLYAFYSSFIIIIVTADPKIFKSVSDFKSHGFEMISQPRSVISGIILETMAKEWQDGGATVKAVNNSFDVIPKMLTGRTALITTPAYYFIYGVRHSNISSDEACALRLKMEIKAGRSYSGLFFRKNDPFQRFANYRSVLMRERGMAFKLQLNYNEATIEKCGPRPPSVHKMELNDVRSAVYVIAIGFVASVVLLLYECLRFRSTKSFYLE